MLMVSAIVILGTIFNNASFAPLATTLVAVPVGFVSLETLNKKYFKETETSTESKEAE